MSQQIGVVICGFGRAGQIHFSGIGKNHLCKLKYVVEVDTIKELVQAKLDEYFMKEVKVVGVQVYENVSL